MRARWLFAVIAAASACAGGEMPLAPSPVIIPDAARMQAGQAQVFTVQNAVVRSFSVGGVRNWTACVDIDASYQVANSVRLVARGRCGNLLYLTADVEGDPSPLVAVVDAR